MYLKFNKLLYLKKLLKIKMVNDNKVIYLYKMREIMFENRVYIYYIYNSLYCLKNCY